MKLRQYLFLFFTLVVACQLTFAEVVFAGSNSSSGDSKIESVFASKSLTCTQKYNAVMNQSSTKNVAFIVGAFMGCFIGALAWKTSKDTFKVLCGAGGAAILASTVVYWRDQKRVNKSGALIKQAGEQKVKAKRSHDYINQLYLSQKDYFDQNEAGPDFIASSIVEAVRSGKACEDLKPWQVADFANYALLAAKLQHDQVLKDAEDAGFLPSQSQK